MHLAYAYGFRSPALRELYFDFHDAIHQIVGNPDLEAEHSNSFSGSFNYLISAKEKLRISTSTNLFYNDFRNLINFAQTTNDPNLYMYVNIDRFKTTGGSVEAKMNTPALSASLGFSYIGRYNSFSDDPAYDQQELPGFTWSPELNSNLIYTLKKFGASAALFYKFTGARPGYQLFYNGSTGRDELHETKLSSFHWADLTVSKNLFKYLTLTGGIKNLFDVNDLDNTSTSTATGSIHGSNGPVPMGYGRSYFLGLAFQINK
jgi:outer membrane receptor for ferrienterochelin and colicins